MRAHHRPDRPRTIQRPGRLGVDESGATLVEFGLILPIMAFLTMGIIDFAQGFAEKFRLVQAAQRTIEYALVGSAVEKEYKFLETEAAAAAKVPLDKVKVTTWLECDRSAPRAFDGECAESEMVARYVQIRIDWFYRPQFKWGPLGRAFGQTGDGDVPLVATAAVRVQ